MKRRPTEEQKARAAERRESFKQIVEFVARLSETERLEIVNRLGCVTTCEGHALSVFNTCLILNQNPTASLVGGFQQWRRLGRTVRKGEQGLMIWIPKGTNDEPTGDDVNREKPNFLMGYVFDVAQTEPATEQQAA
ncbi:MAG: ArdC-like ssDNA-binding domain-containing protein [Acidobacteriota bacterium]